MHPRPGVDLDQRLYHQRRVAAASASTPAHWRDAHGDSDAASDASGSVDDAAMQRLADSIMHECPVCGRPLDELYGRSGGSSAEGDLAEQHVADCLRRVAVGRGVGMVISGNRYIAQTLRESLGVECVICFNELEAGDRIARLNCLCIYHEACIEEWFKRKNSCPVHYK
ncbi:hypothetical protein HK405_003655 [Cladochytrium tenue]|nr:hypothetical protein HK405_003655 [Cladochytrium tenue]